MVVPELEKLASDDRNEFVRLYHMPPHELTSDERQKLEHLGSKINSRQYEFEIKREEAKKPQRLCCTITDRNPYLVLTTFGEIRIPDLLVPPELKQLPSDEYNKNAFFAVVALDLDTRTANQLQFEGYLKKATSGDLEGIPTLNSLPAGTWPKNQ